MSNDLLMDRGIARGWSDIKTDSINFEFGDERFTFPAMSVIPRIARFNGYFYEAKIEDLRGLSQKK